jgi:hypothetical protein
VSFRAQFQAQTAAVEQKIGIGDGTTGEISISSYSTQSTTHWSLFANGVRTTGTGTLDANWHTFTIAADGTHVTDYVDHVQDSQILQSSTSANGHYGWFNITGNVASQVKATRALAAYVNSSGDGEP